MTHTRLASLVRQTKHAHSKAGAVREIHDMLQPIARLACPFCARRQRVAKMDGAQATTFQRMLLLEKRYGELRSRKLHQRAERG